MSKANEPPPPPTAKKRMETKSIEGANMKELESTQVTEDETPKPSSGQENESEKEQVAPEIKANTAEVKADSEGSKSE